MDIYKKSDYVTINKIGSKYRQMDGRMDGERKLAFGEKTSAKLVYKLYNWDF